MPAFIPLVAGLAARSAATLFPRAVPTIASRIGITSAGTGTKWAGPMVGTRAGLEWGKAAGGGFGPTARALSYPFRRNPKTAISTVAMPFMSFPFGGDEIKKLDIGTTEAPPAFPLSPMGGATTAGSGALYGAYSGLTDGSDAPAFPGSYMDTLNDPDLQRYVDQQISALQRPLVRQKKDIGRMGEKQIAGISAAGAESQRMGRALRGEERASRSQYMKQAQQRQESTTDQLADIADRLIGSSNVDEMFRGERGQQQLESIGRTGEAMARESSQGAGGSLDTMSVMADLDAVEKMRDAQDIKDAREQMRIDKQDIDARIADIAAQSPQLAMAFADKIRNEELQKYREDSANYRSRVSAMNDYLMKVMEQQSETMGSNFNITKWINSKGEETYASIKVGDPLSGQQTSSIKPIKELQSDPVEWNSFLEQLNQYTQAGYNPYEVAEYLYGMYKSRAETSWDKKYGLGEVAE